MQLYKGMEYATTWVKPEDFMLSEVEKKEINTEL